MRAFLLALLIVSPAWAGGNLTVVELFTSQGCSSCPPADALLGALAREDAGLLPLDWHVTYWDRLGWKDPYSLPAATARQEEYARLLRTDTVYTPQMVIAGRREAVGHDRAAVVAAIGAARRDGAAVAVRVNGEADGVRVSVGSGSGAGAVLLVGYDAQHATRVGAGENGGRVLNEVNVVRGVVRMGGWTGAAASFAAARPAGERVAVLLQAVDGRVLGAATLD